MLTPTSFVKQIQNEILINKTSKLAFFIIALFFVTDFLKGY